ncbi:MAG TPA: fused MFS/spermidine synthase [Polyangia bacterium]|nr:fused MFS/spermidine synthase [Polyangia bacterium]
MRAAVLAAFFLSGASSLLFESLWTRELTLVFGSTTLAISTVLATFMGGLGLGSFLAGRRADRLRDPLRVYALVEGSVGLYALAVPLLLSGYPALARALWRVLGDHYALASLARFVASAILLGLPTTLMGATLPLLARHFVQQPWEWRGIGWRLGTLYAVNTFGALVGAFATGFVLLPLAGVRATNFIGAGINLSLCMGLLALRARERLPESHGLPALDPGVDAKPAPAVSERARRLTLYAFAASGATAMTLEVLWTRALAVIIGSSVYSFTLILVAFLLGLGGGARLFSRISERTERPVAALAALHVATAACVLFTYLRIDELPKVFVSLLRGSSFDVDKIMAFQFILAVLIILLPALLMGGVFPLTIRIYAGGAGRVGRDVGIAYSVNTGGAIVGSFLAGFVVLPLLGLERGIISCALIDAGLGIGLLLASTDYERARRWAWAVAVGAVFIGVTRALPHWQLLYFQSGLFRVSIAREIINDGKWTLPELLYYKDGTATTVSVERWGKTFALKNNGKVDASSGDDMPTQIMVGLLPFFFTQPRAPSVAVIGYGSGVTVGAVTQAPTGRIDVVELEPAVVTAARWFDGVNHQPLTDSRVRLHIGDGRNFLLTTRAHFDVIISEPSNPWITGVSNLFTREYWRMAKERLAPGGVFCQWAQLYEMSPLHIKTILRTFASEFPYTYVFAAEDLSSDVLLLASNHRLWLDRVDLTRRLVDPRLRAEAERAGVKSAEDVIAYLLLAPDELASFTAGAPVNTDDNAFIEFGTPRDLLGYHQYDPYLARVYGADWPYARLEPLLTGFEGGADYARLAESLLAHGKVREAKHFIERAGAQAGQARRLAELLATDPKLPDDLDPPRFPGSLSAKEQEKLARQYMQVEKLMRTGQYEEAQKLLDDWPSEIADQSGADLALLYGTIAWHADAYSDALEALRPLEKDPAYLLRRPEALHVIGRLYYSVEEYGKAVGLLKRYLSVRPIATR